MEPLVAKTRRRKRRAGRKRRSDGAESGGDGETTAGRLRMERGRQLRGGVERETGGTKSAARTAGTALH